VVQSLGITLNRCIDSELGWGDILSEENETNKWHGR
jgi:hypothetical protein